ncbi:virulence factor Mce-like protein [Nocardia tenerifensis]|uniref:Virulence factor Mce-like protein n=1 Tax=Nocardia tenerifensis TaxID=228006 RepID=A0A318KUG9_9NOCA|nr:MCE family protein [Nocardia tenerifensis]PXX68401.1 virulence factor Mce-like protein [Nocardia tenerifensis]
MIIDPSGRGPSARQLSLAGLALTTVTLLLLSLLGLRYTGRFEDNVGVVAVLTSTGDGLPEHADVKFRGMIVGSVAGVEVVAKGERQRAELDLKPDVASMIPAAVTARVIPNNIFGVTAIELVDNGQTAEVLRAGAEIPEDTSEGTVQLQTTLSVLRDVLDNIQPEKLGRVLATLADALDPAARVPGSTIERLDQWLTQVHAIPGIGDLLGDLGRAATALSVSAPDLVGVLSESVTTARTLTERRDRLVALLTNANGAVDSVNSLFARNPDAGKEVVSGVDELFGSLAEDPRALPETAANLNVALHKLRSVFGFGPSRQMIWKMDVSFTPFQQYTAADCPHYGSMAGPRCGGPSVPETAPSQEFPAQQTPKWLDAAGPAPVLPAIPGIPLIPGLTAPAAAKDPAPNPQGSSGLRGTDAVAAIVGGPPTAAQYLLLSPLLAGGSVVPADKDGR